MKRVATICLITSLIACKKDKPIPEGSEPTDTITSSIDYRDQFIGNYQIVWYQYYVQTGQTDTEYFKIDTLSVSYTGLDTPYIRLYCFGNVVHKIDDTVAIDQNGSYHLNSPIPYDEKDVEFIGDSISYFEKWGTLGLSHSTKINGKKI